MLVWHRTKQYRKATEDERLKYYVEKKEKELYCFSSEVSRSFGSAQYTLKWEQSVGCFFFRSVYHDIIMSVSNLGLPFGKGN